jgi:hypothetical protein
MGRNKVEHFHARALYSDTALSHTILDRKSEETTCDLFEAGGKILTFVEFEDFTAVTIKNVVCWDVAPCGSCKNRRFGGTCHFHFQGRRKVLDRLIVSLARVKFFIIQNSEPKKKIGIYTEHFVLNGMNNLERLRICVVCSFVFCKRDICEVQELMWGMLTFCH